MSRNVKAESRRSKPHLLRERHWSPIRPQHENRSELEEEAPHTHTPKSAGGGTWLSKAGDS